MAITNYHTVNGEMIGETTSAARTGYLTDGLGSVTATQGSTGNVLATYRYKPYGALLAKTGTGADPRFRWAASEGSHTSLSLPDYYQLSHYSSSMGRRVSKSYINHLALRNGSSYKFCHGCTVNSHRPCDLIGIDRSVCKNFAVFAVKTLLATLPCCRYVNFKGRIEFHIRQMCVEVDPQHISWAPHLVFPCWVLGLNLKCDVDVTHSRSCKEAGKECHEPYKSSTYEWPWPLIFSLPEGPHTHRVDKWYNDYYIKVSSIKGDFKVKGKLTVKTCTSATACIDGGWNG